MGLIKYLKFYKQGVAHALEYSAPDGAVEKVLFEP
jgi:hypothetical protein